MWRDIGLALRMRNPELDVIRESHPLSPKDCLKAVLSGWLQGRNRPPTWGALCEAVAEPAGGNNRALAEQIAHNHGVTLKPCENLMYIHHCHNVMLIMCACVCVCVYMYNFSFLAFVLAKPQKPESPKTEAYLGKCVINKCVAAQYVFMHVYFSKCENMLICL